MFLSPHSVFLCIVVDTIISKSRPQEIIYQLFQENINKIYNINIISKRQSLYSESYVLFLYPYYYIKIIFKLLVRNKEIRVPTLQNQSTLAFI